MSKEHVISDEVLDKVQIALFKGENWMVYNNSLYFIEPDNIDFFRTEEEAKEFCQNNYSDYDCYSTLYVQSSDDLIKQVSYGEALDEYLNFININGKQLNELQNNLKELGFSERLFPALEFYLRKQEERFQLLERERSQSEKTCYTLSFERKPKITEYYLAGYEATLRIHPAIPDTITQGINLKELDSKMKAVDWSIDHHTESLVYDCAETQEGREFLDRLDIILKEINKLYQSEGVGKEAAEKLMYKHWYSEPWEPNSLSLEHLRQNYEWKKTVSVEENKLQTKSQTYLQLKEVALKDLEVNKHFITNQSFVMNEQNLKYLKDNIKYLGFGEKLFPELQKNLEEGLPQFQLKVSTEFNEDKIGAELHFKKSETNDMYFLNRYDATLEKSDGKKLSQPFYLNKGNGITIKEAYNLLNGRSVNKDLTNKEGEKYNAWIQLDLTHKNERGNYDPKQFHKNYGYDLEQSLSKFPIKELTNVEQKDMLIKSLEKGNLQSVTFEHKGKEQKMYVEANPQLKTINIYDTSMKLQQHDSLKKNESGKQLNGEEQKQNIDQKTKDKIEDKKQEIDQSNKNGKVVKMKSEDSLLPKKRTSQKKGLSLS